MFRRMHEATYAYRLATAYQKNGLLYLVDENLDRAGITGRHIFISPPKNLANSEEMYLGCELGPPLSLFVLEGSGMDLVYR